MRYGLAPHRRLGHNADPSMATESHEAGRKIHGEGTRQPCAHQRLVDDLRDEQGRPTGKLRCVECNAALPDQMRDRTLNKQRIERDSKLSAVCRELQLLSKENGLTPA